MWREGEGGSDAMCVHQHGGGGDKRLSVLGGEAVSTGPKSNLQKGQIDDALTGQTAIHKFRFCEAHLRRHVAPFRGSRR